MLDLFSIGLSWIIQSTFVQEIKKTNQKGKFAALPFYIAIPLGKYLKVGLKTHLIAGKTSSQKNVNCGICVVKMCCKCS